MVRRVVKILQSFFGELLASFIFGFSIYTAIIGTTLTEQSAAPVIVGLTVGLSGVAVIYSFCDITVAHFNPAITLAAMVSRRLPFLRGLFYIVFQTGGFILAGLGAISLFPGEYKDKMDIARPKIQNDDSCKGRLFAAEFFLTAILVYVAFAVDVNPYEPPKDEHDEQLDPDEEITEGRKTSAPIAIGFTLGFLAFLGIGTSGGAFNPGLTIAPMILSGIWDNWWVYLLAQFSGGIVGGFIQAYVLYKLF